MKRFKTTSIICILALQILPSAWCESGPVRDPKILLDEAKKDQVDRIRGAMQKELDRLAEDVNRGKQETDDLQRSVSDVGNAVTQTKNQLTLITGRKKRVDQDLELIPLRIEAERLKIEALNLLSTAHTKAMDAVAMRNEELKLRMALVSSEMQKLSEPEKLGASDGKKGQSDSTTNSVEIRRNLQKAESRSLVANEKAREAMQAASLRLQQAEAATAKAEKKQVEIDLENSGNPSSEHEPPKPKLKTRR